MSRWIPYLAAVALLASVAVVVYKPSDDRIVGVWVLDTAAVAPDTNPTQRRVLVQLLKAYDFKISFTPRRMQIGMTTDGGRQQRAGGYQIRRKSRARLELDFHTQRRTSRCIVEFTKRGIVLFWNEHSLPLRRP